MAGESVWIDLDEVQASAKTIMGLLKELEGPANQLEAVFKQVQASVYGTDLLGKSLQGSGSSVGGLAQHQEQVLEGIRVLMRNASAMGENLLTMAARHSSNDEQVASALSGISGTGAVPASPAALSLRSGTVPATATQVGVSLPDGVAAAPLAMPVGRTLPDLDPVAPPPPVAPVSVPDAGVGYHDPDAPDLDYNDHPNPLFVDRPHGGGGGHMLI